MRGYRLPSSGVEIRLIAPNGMDEAALADLNPADPQGWADVAARLMPPVDDAKRWGGLPASDLDAGFLALRRALLGDHIAAAARCAECGAENEMAFSATAYLAGHQPRLAQADPADWIALDGGRCRIPSIDDLLAAHQQPDPARALAARCLDVTPAARRRAHRLLDRLAPALAGPVAGRCPACDADIRAWFAPARHVVGELARRARHVFADVHRIATAYGWSEAAILALPPARRARYALLAAA